MSRTSLQVRRVRHPRGGDAGALHAFVTHLQVLAGRLDSTSWDEALTTLVGAVHSLPPQLGPLAWWTVRGLTVDSVSRLAGRYGRVFPFELVFRRDAARASCPVAIADAIRLHLGVVGIVSGSARPIEPRIERALGYIWGNCTRPSVAMDDVAAHVGLSRWHLSRLLVRQTGTTYRDLLRSARMARAQPLLREQLLSMKEIAARLGYLYATEFDRQFHRTFGMSPTAWRLKQ